MIDIPNEYHNHFILNQIHDMYITSPLKFIDKIFDSFSKLFVDQMVRIWMNSHIQIIDQLSKVNVWNKENEQVEQIFHAREALMNILIYLNFSKLCYSINNVY